MSQRQTKVDAWNAFALDMIGIQVDGKIVFMNTMGAKLFGAVCPEQVVGKPAMDFVHPDCRGLVEEQVRQVTKGGIELPLFWIVTAFPVESRTVAALPDDILVQEQAISSRTHVGTAEPARVLTGC